MSINQIRITVEARNALRSAIKNHDNWTSAFRNKHGFSFANMNKDDYFKAAELLGLNIAEIVKGATNDKAEKARRVFDDKPVPVAAAHNWDDNGGIDNLEAANRRDREKAIAAAPVLDRKIQIEAAPVANDDKADAIARMLRELMAAPQIDRLAVENIVSEKLAEFAGNFEAGRRVLEIKVANKPDVKIEGHNHPAFEETLSLVAQGANVMLKGPAGCGKTYLASRVAKALDAPFSSISGSAGVSESQLTGRLLPIGDGGKFQYVASQFVEIYQNGGVFLFDEMDAFDANCLITINMATANGGFDIESRAASGLECHVKRHAETALIAATNTFGTGADAMYVGRAQLDGATLDRWYIIEMDYDKKFELTLAPQKIVDYVWHLRDVISANRFRRIASTRSIQRAVQGLAAGRNWQKVQNDLVVAWTAQERAKIDFAKFA